MTRKHPLFQTNADVEAPAARKFDSKKDADGGLPLTPCSSSSFGEFTQLGDKGRSLVSGDLDAPLLGGTQSDLDGRSPGADDGDRGNVLGIDPGLCRCAIRPCRLLFGVCESDKIREYHRLDELVDMLVEADCQVLRMHHSDWLGGDTRRLLAFLEVIGHDLRVAGDRECSIVMRGSEIIVSWTNGKHMHHWKRVGKMLSGLRLKLGKAVANTAAFSGCMMRFVRLLCIQYFC